MSNGCLCCTLRGDLIGALSRLAERKDKYDYILIETTGLALPGPIVQTFYLDENVREQFYLDGIVTMVDAKHILQHLDKHHHHDEKDKHHGENKEKKHEEEDDEEEENEAEDQIAFADRIIINKIDVVSSEAKAKVLKKIRKINGLAPIIETINAKIEDLRFLIDIRAFDIDRVLTMDPKLLNEMSEEEHKEEHKEGHKEEHHHHDHHGHGQHDSEVTSFAIVRKGLIDKDLFEDWLLDLLTEQGLDIYRTKGILDIGDAKPLVVQAVHSLLDMRLFGEWKSSDRTNKIVFIGKYLNKEELVEGFESCIRQ